MKLVWEPNACVYDIIFGTCEMICAFDVPIIDKMIENGEFFS